MPRPKSAPARGASQRFSPDIELETLLIQRVHAGVIQKTERGRAAPGHRTLDAIRLTPDASRAASMLIAMPSAAVCIMSSRSTPNARP